MAVVCCATPSELYLEETRSTLAFASRAKLVKTNAQVNEVLDDQSLIRKLQRELAEAKKSTGGGNQTQQLRALETEAANAGKERREAVEKLKRLQNSFLNSSSLFDASRDNEASWITVSNTAVKRKRRLSDGGLNLKTMYETPAKQSRLSPPKSVPCGKEPKQKVVLSELSPQTELGLVRQAITAKGAQTRILQETIDEKSRVIEMTESNLKQMGKEGMAALEQINKERDASAIDSANKVDLLNSDLNQLRSNVAAKDEAIVESTDRIVTLEGQLAQAESVAAEQIAALEQISEARNAALEQLDIEREASTVDSRDKVNRLNELNELRSVVTEKEEAIADITETLTAEIVELKSNLSASEHMLSQSDEVISDLQDELALAKTRSSEQTAAMEQLNLDIDANTADLQAETEKLNTELNELGSVVAAKDYAIVESTNRITALQEQLTQVESMAAEQIAAMKQLRMERDAALEQISMDRDASAIDSDEKVDCLYTELSALRSDVAVNDMVMVQSTDRIAALLEGVAKAETKSVEQAVVVDQAANQRIAIQADLECLIVSKKELQQELGAVKETVNSVSIEKELLLEKLLAGESQIQTVQDATCGETSELSKTIASLSEEKFELAQLLAAANESVKEAREAALTADDELELKEQKLEQIEEPLRRGRRRRQRRNRATPEREKCSESAHKGKPTSS